MPRHRTARLAWPLLALLAGAAGLAWWQGWGQPGPVPSPHADAAAPRPGFWEQVPAARSSAAPPAAAASSALPATRDRRGWPVDRGRLIPSPRLRERFDTYLLNPQRLEAAALRVQVEHEARTELGPTLAAEVMQLWDGYAQLSRHVWSARADLQDRRTWQPALDERRAVRTRLLGPLWADAFYREDDRALLALIATDPAQLPQPQEGMLLRPQPGLTPEQAETLYRQRASRFGDVTARRLQQLDAAQADWARRLQAAQEQWANWQGQPQLSADEREAAMDAYLAAHFSSDELPRTRMQLGLE